MSSKTFLPEGFQANGAASRVQCSCGEGRSDTARRQIGAEVAKRAGPVLH